MAKFLLRLTFYICITVLLVSCANYHQNDSFVAESAETVVITGSRLAKAESSRVNDVSTLDREASKSDLEKQLSVEDSLSWKPSAESKNNAIIQIGKGQKLKPKAMDVTVRIDGYRARVIIDGFYTNPHDRDLEGDFKFRLPSEAVPYFFAFGQISQSFQAGSSPLLIDSKYQQTGGFLKGVGKGAMSPQELMLAREQTWLAPKQAIMVSREKAAFAYNDTVAKQVDPALLEWGGAGIFSAKVFPLFAKQTHRVVIGYDLDLRRLDGDLMLDLPLSDRNIEKRVNLTINSKGSSSVMLNKVISGELQPSQSILGNNELIETSLSSNKLDGIRVTVKEHANVTLVQSDDVANYFTRQWVVDLPKESTVSNPNAIFVVDTSLSASPDKFYQWLELLEQILSNNEQDIEQFAFMHFNTQTHWWRPGFVKNNPKQRERLKNHLQHLVLEGATNLSAALEEAALPKWRDEEVTNNSQTNPNHASSYDVFLFSDGASTWGETEPYFISESVKRQKTKNSDFQRLFTYSLGVNGEDQSLLQHLTREIGGGNFVLSKDENYTSLSKAHRWLPWSIAKVSAEGSSDLLIRGRPNTVYPGQLLTFAGRSKGTVSGPIRISVKKGSKEKSFDIATLVKIDSTLAARSYGQIAVNQLESLGELEGKVAAAYANYYRVPGRSSSLLMLESNADYERYKINPQQDKFVVKRRVVTSVFESIRENIAAVLSSPKKRFLDMLQNLSNLDMIKFKLPGPAMLMIEYLPESAFSYADVNKTLNDNLNESRPMDDFKASKGYLKMLKSGDINYEKLRKESRKRLKRYDNQSGLTVLSSLVENSPNDVMILREVAFEAEKLGLFIEAFQLHMKAAKLRPFEPQSYNYLAKLAHKQGLPDLALAYFEIGMAGEWSARFGDFKLIHQIDYMNFLKQLESADDSGVAFDATFDAKDFAELKYEQLLRQVESSASDLIIAIGWNSERSDVDLHVIEPSGEECYYSHKETKSGGRITADVTQGYGPEMYMNHKAPKGEYEIYVKYFSSDRNKMGVNTSVQVRIIENWGRANQTEQLRNIILKNSSDKQLVAEFRRR